MVAKRTRRSSRSAARPIDWSRHADADLLDLRFDRLGLRADTGPLRAPIARLYADLERVGIELRPHIWLSTDWFSPDGVPGIALPFYLGHPRLVRLERAQMLEAEGSTAAGCLKLLRHEAGHALDTAFRLSRRALYRETFGKRSEPYRRHYSADPQSNAFVHHLDRWYAQSHPAEDFAESFAVWLGGRWRAIHAGSQAYAKLQAVDELVRSIRGRRPSVRTREESHSISKLDQTLGDHYRMRRWKAAHEAPPPFEQALRRRFLTGRPWSRSASAAVQLRRVRRELVQRAAAALGASEYTCDQVVQLMLHRACELGLVAHREGEPFDLEPFVTMIRNTVRTLRRGDYLLSR